MGPRVNQLVFDGESLITPEAISSEFTSARSKLYNEDLVVGKAHLSLILNIAKQRFEKGNDAGKAIRDLSEELYKTRRRFNLDVWNALIPLAQNHAVLEFLLQDPFTRWSYEKPRGYSGDAQLLDFIYGHPSVTSQIANATPLGRELYGCTRMSLSSQAVRERRDLLTRHVDDIAAGRGSEAEILTIAAGHLREANRSIALEKGLIKRWVALDQDPLSVGSITRDFRGTPVDAIDGSVRGLLTDAYKLDKFDFIYAAGLYDYLSQSVAVKLTQKCLQMLKPNGVLLFANFAQDIPDDGYMETFMNWALLLRSEADMWDIINASVDRNAVEADVHFGANRNIVYGIVRKRA
jgi:SAM-dependent methyltransferase